MDWTMIGAELVGIVIGSTVGPYTSKYLPDKALKILFIILAFYVLTPSPPWGGLAHNIPPPSSGGAAQQRDGRASARRSAPWNLRKGRLLLPRPRLVAAGSPSHPGGVPSPASTPSPPWPGSCAGLPAGVP